jgi:hypothetical protein
METAHGKGRWRHRYAAVLKDLAQSALRRNQAFEKAEFRLILNLLEQPQAGPPAVASAIDEFVEERRQAYPTPGMDEAGLSDMLAEHVTCVYEVLRVHPPQVVEAVLRDILRAFGEADRAVDEAMDRRERIRAMFRALDGRTRCVVAAVVKLYRMRFEEGPDLVQDLEREFADKDPEELVALCCGAAEMQPWLWLMRTCDTVHEAYRLRK